MKMKMSSVLLSFLWGYLLCQLSGCSYSRTTYATIDGKSVLASRPNKITTGDMPLAIKPDTTIEILLKSGKKVKGKFSGMMPIPAEEYSERYATARAKNREVVVLPELGESVALITKDGKQHEGEVFGFDFGLIRLRKKDSTSIGTWYLNTLDSIVDSGGRRIESKTLRELMRGREIPFSSALILKIKKEESRIELDDVSQIQMRSGPSTATKTAFVVAGVFFAGVLTYVYVKILTQAVKVPSPLYGQKK